MCFLSGLHCARLGVEQQISSSAQNSTSAQIITPAQINAPPKSVLRQIRASAKIRTAATKSMLHRLAVQVDVNDPAVYESRPQ